jgi:phosphoglycerate dehydrogenase-like enzyme
MKDDAVLVNTARGALVDEHAVAAALTGSRLGRYAADVLAEEPPGEDSPLPGHPHTVITPHTGGLTNVAYRQMCVTTSQNVLRILAGREPEEISVANRRALAGA